MTLKAHEFDGVVSKFGFQTRDSRDLLAWLEYDGKLIVRTKRSKGGGGDLPFQHSIRQQLKLSEAQLRDAISCSLDRNGYLEILKGKGLLDTGKAETPAPAPPQPKARR